MDLAWVRTLLDEERKNPKDSAVVSEVLPELTLVHALGGDWHQITFSRLGAGADAVIEAVAARYRRSGQELEWTVYAHDEPSDLCERLTRHGFVIGALETVVVLDLHECPPAWISATTETRVERVANASQVALYQSVSERVFDGGHERIAAELLAALRTGSQDQLGFIAFDGGEAASIGRLLTHAASPFAGLYGGGTLPAHRGRGLYRAQLAARARAALERGARFLRVDALPTSLPILQRLGFVRVTQAWPCVSSAR